MLVLANDQDQVAFLGKQLLAAEPAELLVSTARPCCRIAMRLIDDLWKSCAQDSEVGKGQPLSGRLSFWRPLILRRRAGSASPTLWEALPRRRRIRGPVPDLGKCLAARARWSILPALMAAFRENNRTDSERSLIAGILAAYAADKPTLLADLLADLDEEKFASDVQDLRNALFRD